LEPGCIPFYATVEKNIPTNIYVEDIILLLSLKYEEEMIKMIYLKNYEIFF